MRSYKKKSALLGFGRSTVGIILLFVACVFLSRQVWIFYEKERGVAERRAHVESQVAALEVRKASLEERVEYLSNERGIEAEMRRNFDVAKPGEEVVIIMDDPNVRNIQPLPEIEKAKPWWKFW